MPLTHACPSDAGLAHNRRDSKISALEAKLQAMEAERATSTSASETEGDAVVGDSGTKRTVDSSRTASPLPPPGLPRKPTADTIAKGAAALEAKEAGVKLPVSKEPAKTTLASLGAGMGRP